MAFRIVARSDEVPDGRGLCVRADGIDVGLFRAEGRVWAMENRCPHQGMPLSEGLLDGPVVRCPAHGWEFDVRTGRRPVDPDGFPVPCFPVEVVGDEVRIDLEAPTNLRRR
jgi:nitrite reductase/ring-hydroxylating ferredoxin subunit